MLKDLVIKNRSYRRFYADFPIPRQTLRELVDLARCVASARNLQPLRYILSCTPEKNALIFSCLTWPTTGNYTQPIEEDRPAAYIILVGDTTLQTAIGIDTGIAAQTILLGAVERGLGGVIMGMVQHDPLRAGLHIPERYRILVTISLGKPRERAVIEPAGEQGAAFFWRDAEGVQHVCKRALDEIILETC